jgi:hypothetical protein
VENLTRQLIDKISTPAITMDTASLMDECREIDMKIESDEYLEEFRVRSITIAEALDDHSSLLVVEKHQ